MFCITESHVDFFFSFVLLNSESIYLVCRCFFIQCLKSSLDCEEPNVTFILPFLEVPSSYKDFTSDFDIDRHRTSSVVSRLCSL